MSKKRTFICIPLTDVEATSPLIREHLRYMGVVHVKFDEGKRPWMAVECPHGMTTAVWARQQSERLTSFKRHHVVYQGYGWEDISQGELWAVLSRCDADDSYTRDFAVAVQSM